MGHVMSIDIFPLILCYFFVSLSLSLSLSLVTPLWGGGAILSFTPHTTLARLTANPPFERKSIPHSHSLSLTAHSPSLRVCSIFV